MTDRKTVRVACNIPNGIELRLFDDGYDDGTGAIRKSQSGTVVLAGPHPIAFGANAMSAPPPVVTDVDSDFMTKWMEQNEKNPFVMRGSILALKDEADSQNAEQQEQMAAPTGAEEPPIPQPQESRPQSPVNESGSIGGGGNVATDKVVKDDAAKAKEEKEEEE